MNMVDQAMDYRAFLESKVKLDHAYWRDAIWYCEQAEAQRATPSLFDLDEMEQAA